MSSVQEFEYDGQQITFEFQDGNRMINATQMAKPFGKKVAGFLRLDGTKKYIDLLEKRYAEMHIVDNQAVNKREVLRVIKGGLDTQNQGTWMDEKLALKFAAWLSQEFELWVYDRIEELLLTGKTELTNIAPQGFASTLRLLAQQWEKQEGINEEFREELNTAAERLDHLESKIISVDEDYYTIKGFCSLNKVYCPVDRAKAWGKIATSLSREKDIPTGTAHSEIYGQVRTYHKDILAEVIKG